MATLLQLHFAFNGPFGDAMAEQLKPLAESISPFSSLSEISQILRISTKLI